MNTLCFFILFFVLSWTYDSSTAPAGRLCSFFCEFMCVWGLFFTYLIIAQIGRHRAQTLKSVAGGRQRIVIRGQEGDGKVVTVEI